MEVRTEQPAKAALPIIVTGKFITLQKSFCYLILNGNQVTIQKRAELHILSRYTHFQRTLLSECKDNHLFCYHQRNGQKLNVFIGFCYLFLGYYMSFSYQVHFGNDFLFSYDRFIVRPRFPRLTASLLGCPFIAVTYSWASRREWYGNGVTRRQHANFSRCHSFRTASMTAVCRGNKGGQWKSIHAFLLFLFTPFPDTKVLCAYILLLLFFFAYLFCNSFVPPLAFVP